MTTIDIRTYLIQSAHGVWTAKPPFSRDQRRMRDTERFINIGHLHTRPITRFKRMYTIRKGQRNIESEQMRDVAFFLFFDIKIILFVNMTTENKLKLFNP